MTVIWMATWRPRHRPPPGDLCPAAGIIAGVLLGLAAWLLLGLAWWLA